MHDNIPPEIGIPLAIVLWIAVLIIWFHKPLVNKIDTYFAMRRHKRRERARLRNLAILRRDINRGTMTVEEARIVAGYPVTPIRQRHLAGR